MTMSEEPTSLSDLRTMIAACRGCELYRDATQAVSGNGSTGASLLLLGEQPGDHEDREGEPFVGPAGELLDRALAEAGIAPEDVFVTNVVKHFRFKTVGKRRIHVSPAQRHVAACTPWLIRELELVGPVGVVLLGGTAGKALYGPSFKVGAARGRLGEWPQERLPLVEPPWVLATTHPSAVLRARNDRAAAFDALVDDLRVAAAALS
jgi:DNA polymerase